MTLKITVPKMYEFIFKLENVVETCGVCRKLSTFVEITSLGLFFVEKKGRVILSNMGDTCNIWKKIWPTLRNSPNDRQLLAIRQNQLVANHGLASCNGQLFLTELIFENFAFVPTYLK